MSCKGIEPLTIKLISFFTENPYDHSGSSAWNKNFLILLLIINLFKHKMLQDWFEQSVSNSSD